LPDVDLELILVGKHFAAAIAATLEALFSQMKALDVSHQ
jgi:hypothetical protein